MALADDKRAFPPYNACFVLREQLIDQHPEVRIALTMLSNHLGDEVMRDLNRRVDVQHQRVEQVVKDFLATQP
jgi:glycine betaine/choline ABC-type transport system substrate-binding protein